MEQRLTTHKVEGDQILVQKRGEALHIGGKLILLQEFGR